MDVRPMGTSKPQTCFRIQTGRRDKAGVFRRNPRHPRLSAGSRRVGTAHAPSFARQTPRRKRRLHPRAFGSSGSCGRPQSHCHAAAAHPCRAAYPAPRRASDPAEESRRQRRVWLAAGMLYRGDDARRIARLAEVANGASVPLIAVNDVLYHAPERRALQDVVTCIREHLTLESAGRTLETNAERHIKSPQEMARLFQRALYRKPSAKRFAFSKAANSRSKSCARPNTPTNCGKVTPRRRMRWWPSPKRDSRSVSPMALRSYSSRTR